MATLPESFIVARKEFARVAKLAVIGAGMVGRAWAVVFARAGHSVSVYVRRKESAGPTLTEIGAMLDDLHAQGLIDEPTGGICARIAITDRLSEALEGAAYAQENVLETPAAKREIFALMDECAAAGTILASSTSAIPCSAFSEGLKGRGRCIVAHPVNPPHVLPLVELSPAPWTSSEVVSQAFELHELLGQVPIIVRKEIPGFILNRLQGSLLNEAFRLVEEGYATAEDVDKTIKNGLGLRWSFMGPFETIDLNAPGGISDYAKRYGPFYHSMAAAQKPPHPWSDELIAKLHAERRTALPESERAERLAWRDRRLMALAKHKLAQKKLESKMKEKAE